MKSSFRMLITFVSVQTALSEDLQITTSISGPYLFFSFRKSKSSSKYSNFDDSSVAIENPGYRTRTSFPSATMDDPNYSEVDVAQMKPVTTTS